MADSGVADSGVAGSDERRSDPGGLVRARRLAAGLSQQQLADLAGVSVGMLRDLEQGRTRRPHGRLLERLTAVLLDPELAAPAGPPSPAREPPGPPQRSAGPHSGLWLRVLGPLAGWRDGEHLVLGRPRQRAVLGLLAVNAGSSVHRDELVDGAWGQAPPAAAVNLVQTYIGRLRQTLDPGRPPRDPAGVLVSTGRSYRLQVGVDELDWLLFKSLAGRAAAAIAGGDLLAGCQLYEQALTLWHGEPLADVDCLRGGTAVTVVRRAWAAAVSDFADAAVTAGVAGHVLPHLWAMAERDPLDERAHALLMRALAADGQQAAALRVFEDIRARLDDELGIQVGAELSEVQVRILRHEIPAGGARRSVAASTAVLARQLPAGVAGFVGRVDELKTLDGLLDEMDAASGTAGTVVISSIDGAAGIGKTALAVHWAHRVAHRFPDGQLYVNLRGFDPSGRVMAPAEAVRGFLDTLGVQPDRIPQGLDAQAALYRSLVADKRMLVVLDNARDAQHVRPLLPGTPSVLTLVTSRDKLASLVAADGAEPVTLDILSPVEAGDLLAKRLGAGRVAAEPGAVERIVTACARLPLALTIVAARAQQTGFPLAALAGELSEAGQRLDVLTAGDAASEVRLAFSWSYTALAPQAAALFRLLGLQSGPDISVAAAASLAGQRPRDTRRLLTELTRANLLVERAPGRYAFHDLLRAYATDLTGAHDPEPVRRAALTRLLDHYVSGASAADRLLNPHRDPMPLRAAGQAREDGETWFRGYQEAMSWLSTEYRVLLDTLRQAAGAGFDTHVWQLAWTLDTYLNRQGHRREAGEAWAAALAAARRLGDPVAEAIAHRLLAYAYSWQDRYDEALTHYEQALDLSRQAGDATGLAHTHQQLAFLAQRQDHPERGLHHDEQALELFRSAGHLRGEAFTLNALGWCHALLGDYQQALDLCTQGLTRLRQIGDQDGEAAAWDSIGYAHHHLGHHAEAVDGYRHALALFRDLGDRYYEAYVLRHLGDTHRAAADIDAARTAWTRALTILTELDHADAAEVRQRLRELNEVPAAGSATAVGDPDGLGDRRVELP